MIPFVAEILEAFKVFLSYRQLKRGNNEKTTVINVQPPKVDVVPQIHIELPSSDYEIINRKNPKGNETDKGNEPYQPLDDEFYVNFGADAEMSKRGNDIFTIKEK
ncbi:hypothetical protein [Bacteroides congonensis]